MDEPKTPVKSGGPKSNGPNFLKKLHNQTVVIAFVNGGFSDEVKFVGWNKYEILVEDGNGNRALIFKHAVVSLSPPKENETKILHDQEEPKEEQIHGNNPDGTAGKTPE